MKQALIIVDIQNDFLPGGALAVPAGDQTIPVANRMQDSFDLVVATQDWHPLDHLSFAANHAGKRPGDIVQLGGLSQILWPVHCVQDSLGAAFPDRLQTNRIDRVFRKGTDRLLDSYSGFFDNGHRADTGLERFLQEQDVRQVFVLGLATDYCVKFTALDAVACGFETFLIVDGCRAVNLQPEDEKLAIEEMQAAGVTCLSSDQLPI
jgi:nicotinamidase/pyrazinamidase